MLIVGCAFSVIFGRRESTPIACPRDSLSSIDTDLVVVPWFEEDAPDAVPGLDKASGGELARAVAAKEFQAKPYDLFVTPTNERGWKPKRVAVIGGGRRTDCGGGEIGRGSGRGRGEISGGAV